MLLSNQIKRLRMQKKMSQKEMGLVFNVSKQTVSNWEIGKSKPSHDLLVLMADYFGVSVNEMYGRSDAKTPIEDEWPEVIRVLRESGKNATPEDKKRIARIVWASLEK